MQQLYVLHFIIIIIIIIIISSSSSSSSNSSSSSTKTYSKLIEGGSTMGSHWHNVIIGFNKMIKRETQFFKQIKFCLGVKKRHVLRSITTSGFQIFWKRYEMAPYGKTFSRQNMISK